MRWWDSGLRATVSLKKGEYRDQKAIAIAMI